MEEPEINSDKSGIDFTSTLISARRVTIFCLVSPGAVGKASRTTETFLEVNSGRTSLKDLIWIPEMFLPCSSMLSSIRKNLTRYSVFHFSASNNCRPAAPAP